MSKQETAVQQTQHGFLVVWGWFAEELGLLQRMQAVSLRQKRYHHIPQGKVLEFLVALLAGLKHLQEISLAAHPLDRDKAVAQELSEHVQEPWIDANADGIANEEPDITLLNRGIPGRRDNTPNDEGRHVLSPRNCAGLSKINNWPLTPLSAMTNRSSEFGLSSIHPPSNRQPAAPN